MPLESLPVVWFCWWWWWVFFPFALKEKFKVSLKLGVRALAAGGGRPGWVRGARAGR